MQPTFSSSRILLPVRPWFIFFSLIAGSAALGAVAGLGGVFGRSAAGCDRVAAVAAPGDNRRRRRGHRPPLSPPHPKW